MASAAGGLISATVAAGLALLSTAAFAASDIPARYSGQFPGVAAKRNITGTFTGKRLTLKFARVAGKRALRRKAKAASPGGTWICPLDKLFAP
jgi:hypothetical protein